MPNDKEIREAAFRVFEEFKKLLEEHANGDIYESMKKLESYRVCEDDFEEDNYELDLGDDYEEYRITKEISDHIVDCCNASNKIPGIPMTVEEFAEVFYNNEKIGEVSTLKQLMDIKALIKEDSDYVNECFVRRIDKKGVKWDIYINPKGHFEFLPREFFDKFNAFAGQTDRNII